VRLFVSLPLPPEVRDHLAAALRGARTTDVAQWHVTLAFVGEWDDVPALSAGLARAAAATPPLGLRVRDGGTFPGVVWAGLDGDVEGLRQLAADVAAACRETGVRLERRPFRPHVTVARRGGADRLDGYLGPPWTADGVDLVRSHLGASARHEVLERHPLTGT
jgi:RNA 2',3'-cyclic 3'-phosphodiesterase